MVLTPVGIVNERHEPPSFNGVERPFVETLIIPTTWREMGFGLTGDLGRGFRYRTYMISALDAIAVRRGERNRRRPDVGFDASFRNPAMVGRLEYAGVRRLTLGASLYTGTRASMCPAVNPRVTSGEFDGRYSYRRVRFPRPVREHLDLRRPRAERGSRSGRRDSIRTSRAQMRGYYFEPACHIFPRRMRNDLILFARYEKYNTQHRMAAGYVPLTQFNRSSWVTGVTFKPNADVAIKFDYVFNRNASSVVRAAELAQLGFGWWF